MFKTVSLINNSLRLEKSCVFAAGVFLLLIPVLCLFCAEAGFIFGFNVNSMILPVVAVLAAIVVVGLTRNLRIAFKSLIIGFTIAVLTIILAIITDDSSSDGITYHQEIIVCLLNGWNPLMSYSAGCPDPDMELLVAHYPKGIEIMASVFASAFGCIEAGKAINLMTIAGCGLIVPPVIKIKFGITGKFPLFTTGLLAAANPVSMIQAFSYYNDGYCYYLSLLTSIVFLCGNTGLTWRQYSVLGILIVVAATIKFTVLFYVGMTVTGFMLWYLLKGEWKDSLKIGLYSIICFLFAVVIVAYHPYITNWIHCGHPLYPLVGPGSIDIMTDNTPPIYFRHNRIINFAISLLSNWDRAIDARFGGFGAGMPVMLAVSGLAILYGKLKGYSGSGWLYAAVWIVGSCLIFEQSWWARYISFLWTLPLEGVVLMLSMSRGWKISGIVIAWTGIITGVVFMTYSFLWALQLHVARDEVMQMLQGRKAFIDTAVIYNEDGTITSRGISSVVRHFEEDGIAVECVDSANRKQMTPICLTGYYNSDSSTGVNIYFPTDMDDEIKQRFVTSSKARFFRLYNYIPEDIK